MRIYFYDLNNRYIGNRELLQGESIPLNAATVELNLADGQEAYFNNGAWEVSAITVEPITTVTEPTTEEVLDELIEVLVDKGVLY